MLNSDVLRVSWRRWAVPLVFALPACSAAPAARLVPTGTLVNATPPAVTAPTPPLPAALWIEGEGLDPVVELAFSADHAALFVKRKDDSVEAWDAVKGTLLSLHAFASGMGRAFIAVDDAGRWDANPFGATLVHVSTGGVDDAAEKARRQTPGLLAAFVRGQ